MGMEFMKFLFRYIDVKKIYKLLIQIHYMDRKKIVWAIITPSNMDLINRYIRLAFV